MEIDNLPQLECDFLRGIKLLARDAARQGTSLGGRASKACRRHARKARIYIFVCLFASSRGQPH